MKTKFCDAGIIGLQMLQFGFPLLGDAGRQDALSRMLQPAWRDLRVELLIKKKLRKPDMQTPYQCYKVQSAANFRFH
jgi:hypothetical protein